MLYRTSTGKLVEINKYDFITDIEFYSNIVELITLKYFK